MNLPMEEKGDDGMVRIDLSANEAEILSEMLESYLSDLKTERVHTDKRELREELKGKETFLNDLLKRLKSQQTTPEGGELSCQG